MKMPDTKQQKFNIMLPARAMDSTSNGAAGAVRTALQAKKVARATPSCHRSSWPKQFAINRTLRMFTRCAVFTCFFRSFRKGCVTGM